VHLDRFTRGPIDELSLAQRRREFDVQAGVEAVVDAVALDQHGDLHGFGVLLDHRLTLDGVATSDLHAHDVRLAQDGVDDLVLLACCADLVGIATPTARNGDDGDE